jgi:branched-chain amino acid transport system ATP-binding protein
MAATLNGDTRAGLTAAGVSVTYAGLRALGNVDLHVRSKSVTGLIGPNGAGKTTMVNVLTGFQQPTEGRIEVEGRALTGLRPDQVRHIGVARTFQSGRLFRELSVRDNLEVTGVAMGLSRFQAGLEADRVLAWMGIAHLTDTIAGALPYTDERRVAIARAVMLNPDFLLLDEPAAGMSDHEAHDLSELIRRIVDEIGCGVLLIEHNVRMVLNTCEYIFVLDSGEIIEQGTPQIIRDSEQVRHAYMGTQSDIDPAAEVSIGESLS